MNTTLIAPLALAAAVLSIPVHATSPEELDIHARQMMKDSFKDKGIAKTYRMLQLDFQQACSQAKSPSAEVMKQIEAEQMKTIKWPADGKYFGDWKQGEKIAISGRGLTWSDKAGAENGGGCYNCHQLSHHEISYGTIGPSLLEYGKLRGNSDEIVKYTWGKLWNAKAYNACSNMPRNGDAEILTADQIRHLMAYLFDPASPVNKR